MLFFGFSILIYFNFDLSLLDSIINSIINRIKNFSLIIKDYFYNKYQKFLINIRNFINSFINKDEENVNTISRSSAQSKQDQKG